MATESFDASDSPALAGMSEPDMVASLGFVGSFQTDFAEVELVAVNDVTGEHDGQKIELHVKTMLPFQGAFFIPEITATYLSEEVTDYYYGVSAAESRPDRPTYSPDQAVNIKIGLLVRYPLFKGLNLIGMVENTWYDQAITDSPLVGEESRFLATVGILYTF